MLRSSGAGSHVAAGAVLLYRWAILYLAAVSCLSIQKFSRGGGASQFF